MNRRFNRTPALAILASFVVPGVGLADETSTSDDESVTEIVVYGRALTQLGTAQSASEGVVGFDDIQLAPMLRVGELVEAVPGMVATQHSGTGKANQYFIRGFNLDHGTDLAVSVEGVPINMRSHGHGQGYLDLNFLIPETVRTTRYQRGPYSASVGDFSSAASVNFDLYDRLPDNIATLSVGQFGYGRSLLAGSAGGPALSITGALDVSRYDGPWDLNEDLEQTKFMAAMNTTFADRPLRVTLQGYDSQWQSTDQVPQRAISSGVISSLGFIDPDLGGSTERYALTARWGDDDWALSAYAIDYDFSLFSNFTYFLNDPVNGDEFEQRDERRVYGLALQSQRAFDAFNTSHLWRWGGDLRYDDVGEVGLYGTQARVRRETVRQDSLSEASLGIWSDIAVDLTDQLRMVAGVRYDYFDWDVTAQRSENSGQGNDGLISPKISFAFQFSDHIEGYANWGRGFHSNDVRGATIQREPLSGDPVDSVDALIASEGGEFGVRIEAAETFNATLTAFWLALDSELVYVGDAGSTEPNDGSRRYGAEVSLFWQARDWLAWNAAYTYTDARFDITSPDDEIPGAVPATLTTGVNAVWKNGVAASARLRWLSDAPLVENGSLRSDDSLLVNAGLRYRYGNAEYRLDVFNLLGSDAADIAYFYASRLAGEALSGIEDTHLHPLEPRAVRASVTWHFN